MQTISAIYRSEIGPLEVVGNQKGILTITFVEKALLLIRVKVDPLYLLYG